MILDTERSLYFSNEKKGKETVEKEKFHSAGIHSWQDQSLTRETEVFRGGTGVQQMHTLTGLRRVDSEYSHSLSTDLEISEKHITESENSYKSQNMVSDSSFPQ